MTATMTPMIIAPMKLNTAMDSVIHSPASNGDQLERTISTGQLPSAYALVAGGLELSPPALLHAQAQDPGTDPISGGVGASPSTTVPMVAFHRSAHEPSSSMVLSQALTNSFADGSSFVTPIPYGSTVNGSPTTLTASFPIASLIRIDWS